ncbi:MAG: Asp-tRNA(Asn)/Glu-tRNA(Gln) amidotransferase subunit GatC [Brevinema sp.]
MSFDINHISSLASLHLLDEEKKFFSNSMHEILALVETIAKLDLGSYKPVVRSYDIPTVFREDMVKISLSQEEIAQNAPKMDDSFIIVPQVIKK